MNPARSWNDGTPEGVPRGQVGVVNAEERFGQVDDLALFFGKRHGDTAGGYGIAMRIPSVSPYAQRPDTCPPAAPESGRDNRRKSKNAKS
jgi:hypothetical protein